MVYVCRNCEDLFEDETTFCDNCSSENVEAVSSGDMGL